MRLFHDCASMCLCGNTVVAPWLMHGVLHTQKQRTRHIMCLGKCCKVKKDPTLLNLKTASGLAPSNLASHLLTRCCQRLPNLSQDQVRDWTSTRLSQTKLCTNHSRRLGGHRGGIPPTGGTPTSAAPECPTERCWPRPKSSWYIGPSPKAPIQSIKHPDLQPTQLKCL